MKYSKQREVIWKIVESSKDHPSADAIYEKVKLEIPDISLGTVYRNLNVLTENGMIRKLSGIGESDHYDSVLLEHHHMYCKKCHAIYDITYDVKKNIESDFLEKSGFKIEMFDLKLIGICSTCQEKNRKKDEIWI